MTISVSEEIILPDDPRAAILDTITGWVSRDGRFYGTDERIARYAGSTHARCQDCGVTCSKTWLVCPACREKRDIEKHAKRETRPWDGVCMLYSEALDEYFSEPGEILERLEEDEIDLSPSDLRIVLCEPNYPRALEPADYYCDELPEDGDVPDEIAEAFAVLAATLEKCGPLSWSAGKFALDISSLELASAENEGDA